MKHLIWTARSQGHRGGGQSLWMREWMREICECGCFFSGGFSNLLLRRHIPEEVVLNVAFCSSLKIRWIFGVVDVLHRTECGGCLMWWMSGVVDVRCGGCLVWWMSVCNPHNPDICWWFWVYVTLKHFQNVIKFIEQLGVIWNWADMTWQQESARGS